MIDADSKTRIDVLPCIKCEDMLDCENCHLKKESTELYNQIRAEAIDEFVKFANTMPTVETDDGEIRPMWLEEMAEQLKENK